MKNILVSGASGIVGYGILNSLRKSDRDFNLIGTTIYEDSVAQAFSDVFEKAPRTSDLEYISWLIEVIERHNIDFMVPGIEDDVYKWADHVSEIQNTGVAICLNNVELISLCKDKWFFYEFLNKFKSIYVIDTSINGDFNSLSEEFGLPFIMKPRRGYASKGIVTIRNKDEFLKHAHNFGSLLMAQPIIGSEDEEFTTSAFCDGAGSFYCHMTLKRRLSKDGFTEKAEVVELEGISEALSELCKYFKPSGPTNFQFRRENNRLKLLEINPRISSSTSIRSSFGYNESIMAFEYYFEKIVPSQPKIKLGRAVRYVEDFIFYL